MGSDAKRTLEQTILNKRKEAKKSVIDMSINLVTLPIEIVYQDWQWFGTDRYCIFSALVNLCECVYGIFNFTTGIQRCN